MTKYLKLILAFAKNCFMAEMEFRFNFVLWSLLNILWAILGFVSIGLIFAQVPQIAGWTYDQALILAGFHSIYVSFMWIFIFPNLSNFPKLINAGRFDFHLTKPVNARFLCTFRTVEFDSLPRLFISIVVINFLLSSQQVFVPLSSLIQSIIMFFLGAFIFYNIYFSISTVSIFFEKVFNLLDLFNNINDIGRYPSQIFSGLAKAAFSYVIPIGYIATFPTQALLGKSSANDIFVAIGIAIISYLVSNKVWNYSLRHYSSASS